jgi:hypothetical protein
VGGQFYESEALDRFFYYPETYAQGQGWAHWMPTVWFDGVEEKTGAWVDVYEGRSGYRDIIQAHQDLPTPLEMDFQVEYGTKANTVTVHVQVVATDIVYYSDLYLRLAIIESEIGYGGKTYNQVLRDYLPSPAGISFSIADGDTFTHSEDFVIDSAWEADNCHIVVFVQNDLDRIVVQAMQDTINVPTPVVEDTPVSGRPQYCQLSQNYPNPFNANTEIRYQIPEDGRVILKIFNALGQEVRTLVNRDQMAAGYSVVWDGRDDVGGDVTSGLYLCRLKAGDLSKTIKMVLLR